MNADLDESLLRDLAKPLVAEFSPAEQDELFPLLSEAHFAEPEAYASEDSGGGPLAFGLPELTVLMTPVMLAAMSEVVGYVAQTALAKGTRATAKAIRRLFGRGQNEQVAESERLELSPAQWAEVRQIVERVARKGGVSPDQAQLIAYAVTGQGLAGTGST